VDKKIPVAIILVLRSLKNQTSFLYPTVPTHARTIAIGLFYLQALSGRRCSTFSLLPFSPSPYRVPSRPCLAFHAFIIFLALCFSFSFTSHLVLTHLISWLALTDFHHSSRLARICYADFSSGLAIVPASRFSTPYCSVLFLCSCFHCCSPHHRCLSPHLPTHSQPTLVFTLKLNSLTNSAASPPSHASSATALTLNHSAPPTRRSLPPPPTHRAHCTHARLAVLRLLASFLVSPSPDLSRSAHCSRLILSLTASRHSITFVSRPPRLATATPSLLSRLVSLPSFLASPSLPLTLFLASPSPPFPPRPHCLAFLSRLATAFTHPNPTDSNNHPPTRLGFEPIAHRSVTRPRPQLSVSFSPLPHCLSPSFSPPSLSLPLLSTSTSSLATRTCLRPLRLSSRLALSPFPT
jgi:hypothetical protein